MDITEAQPIVMTSPQTRRAHCDDQDSAAPQCMEADVSENNRKCLTNPACHTWPKHNGDFLALKKPAMSGTQGREVCLHAKPHDELKKRGSFKLDPTQQPRCRGGKLETWTADEALEAKLAESVAAASRRSEMNARRAEP